MTLSSSHVATGRGARGQTGSGHGGLREKSPSRSWFGVEHAHLLSRVSLSGVANDGRSVAPARWYVKTAHVPVQGHGHSQDRHGNATNGKGNSAEDRCAEQRETSLVGPMSSRDLLKGQCGNQRCQTWKPYFPVALKAKWRAACEIVIATRAVFAFPVDDEQPVLSRR